jgi:hypothetical protein
LAAGGRHEVTDKDRSVAATSQIQGDSNEAGGTSSAVDPLYVCGRQHSGNTVTAYIFGMVPDCYAANVEGLFFERFGLLRRIKDPAARAGAVADTLGLEDEALAERTRAWLVGWQREHPDAALIDTYRQAMAFATRSAGKRFWIRRATSYIFYAQEILSLMPEARMLYLLRNPYDLCASLKQRAPALDRFLGTVLGWNRGLRLALKMQNAHPRRFLLVRYEDIVTEPVATFQRVFDFAGVPFREAYLDVPHINRAEAIQTRASSTRGLSASRVYYYTGILEPSEIAAVDMLAWTEQIEAFYPDLPHADERPRASARIRALGLLLASPFKLAARQAALLRRHDAGWQLRRMLRRARMILR